MANEEPLITLPLSRFVKSHLGGGYWHSRQIDEDIATVIFSLTQNRTHCFIQFKDQFDEHLEKPILWDMAAWVVASDRDERAKRWSAYERSQRNIFEYNVKVVTKACMKEMLQDEENAKNTAFSLVSQGKIQAIRALGVKKLIEREEEIP